ncbi:MAG: alpha/beta hydrolase [Bacteroidetes bacterium]|nr:alpha/beta hydrolase [Bacteroidota bacterium]
MKKFILIIILAVCAFINVFSQSSFPFDVKVSGEGKSNMILIPGLSCPGEVWNETLEHFKKEYKCYTLTFHGFAGIKADSTTNFKNWESSIARYITENKIQKPVIIGHSIGGGMAMLLAADYPQLIGKIVVVDALPCLGALSNASFAAEKSPDCSMYVKQFQSMDDKQYYQMQKMTMPSLMADTTHLQQAIEWSVKSDRKAIAEIYCQFLNTDQRKSISNIKCPSLVLLEAPFANMKPVMEEQFKNMKTAQLKYSDKALHFIMYDDTNWYLAQLDSFLH